MQIVTMVLVLLLTAAISSFVARLLPLKLPLIQTVSGAVRSALVQFDIGVAPNVFVLLFIPPLLFLYGWRIHHGQQGFRLFIRREHVSGDRIHIAGYVARGGSRQIDWRR